MDILNPDLEWIDGRCYRLLRIQDSRGSEEDDDTPYSPICQADDDYDPDLPIIHQGNKFYITIQVPGQLVCHVLGKQFKTKKALEQYGAKVNVPHRDRSPTIGITISGATKKVVYDTYHKIENIVNTARLKSESTHLITLPIISPDIKKSFLKFKDEVIAKYKGLRGVDESIFQHPDKLHVTIALLVLLDERDKQNAIDILKNCTEKMLKQLDVTEFIVRVNGIEYMNDDPAEVDVLYAKLKELDDDNRLQLIADSIMNAFIAENLSKPQHDKVKLHITIMNTLFRDKLEDQDDRQERITFDARPILKEYGDYDFGEIVVSEIHISVRYSTSQSDGYYMAINKLQLNQ